jgi:two-component system CheB/CheR fusion protein
MTQARARQKDIYYHEIIDVVGNGIICTDAEACIVFANQTALGMLGFTAEELLGASFAMIFVKEDRDLCCPRVIEETLGNKRYEGEFILQRKDGTRFPVHLSSSCLKDEDLEDLVFVINDLTHQKKLQQGLLHSQKMASLGKVVEGISHEIRNPIVSLGGYARRLARTLEPDHPGHRSLQIIMEDVERMEEMLQEINNYVAFAKTYQVNFTKLDLHIVTKDALQCLRIPGEVKLEETYPTEGPWIYGDSNHLRELLLHILENAIEAMPDGGILRVLLKQEDSGAFVQIQDTGVGIANYDIPHIFNPFFSTKTKSTGIGLAKSYIIVEEHTGEIEVDSDVSRGTTFTISFPSDRRQRARRDAGQ